MKINRQLTFWHDIFYTDITSTTAGNIIVNGKNEVKPIQAEFKGLKLASGTTWSIVNANIKK